MNKKETTGGLSFLSVLTLIFITLKLTKVVTWSWAWVLSPIWLPIMIIAVVITIMMLIGLCINISEKGK